MEAPLNPASNPAQSVAGRGSAFPPVCWRRCCFAGYAPFPGTWQHTLPNSKPSKREYNKMKAADISGNLRFHPRIFHLGWACIASKIQAHSVGTSSIGNSVLCCRTCCFRAYSAAIDALIPQQRGVGVIAVCTATPSNHRGSNDATRSQQINIESWSRTKESSLRSHSHTCMLWWVGGSASLYVPLWLYGKELRHRYSSSGTADSRTLVLEKCRQAVTVRGNINISS